MRKFGTNVPRIRARWQGALAAKGVHAGTVADESSAADEATPDGDGVRRVIVVGVDDGEDSVAALDFALVEARQRGCPVEVVTAWLDGRRDSGGLDEGRARALALQDELLSRCLAGLREEPAVDRVVVNDYAGRVLVARAERASMVVVGSGGPSAGGHQLLGSVAEYCVRHAPVPVVIVPAAARRQRQTSSADSL